MKKRRDLGEAAIGQIDTGSFMMKLFLLGGFRGIVADLPLDPRRGVQARARLGPAGVDRRPDHQAPAPLPRDLDLPGLEPGLQRLGRVGRPRGQVPVDQEGDPVRPGGRARRTGNRPTWSGTPPGSTTTSSASPTSRSSSDGCSATMRTRNSRPTTTPSGSRRWWATTTSSSATAGSAGRSRLVDDGRDRGCVKRGRPTNIQYVDPTPQRKGRPDDIAFRSMPAHAQTRYAAGLEKMSMYGIQARFGELAKNEWASALNEWVKIGEHVFMSHNEVRDKDGKMAPRPDQDRRCHQSGAAQDAHREPAVLDPALGRPDELPLLEGAVPGRADRRGGPARELFYHGTVAYKTGGFRQGRREVQGRAPGVEGRAERPSASTGMTTLSRRRPG